MLDLSRNYGLDVGVRGAFSSGFTLGLGYAYRNLNVAESDVMANSVIKEADYGFSGFQVLLGFTW